MRRLGCLLLAAAAMGAASLGAQAAPVRVIAFTGVSTIPLRVAQSHGIFKAHGLDVSIEITPNSQVLREGVATGKYDVAHASVDNGIAVAAGGQADVVIVLGGDDSMNEVIAQPGIGSLEDLRGKTLAVDAPNTAYALQLRRILETKGLKAGHDYTLAAIGGNPQRLEAMKDSQQYAASVLNPPFSILAVRAGLRSLGSATALVGGRYQGIGAFVRRDWAREHRDALVQYLASYIEGLRWFLAPANKNAAIELLGTTLKIPADVAAETYARAAAGGLTPDARLDIEGLRNVLKLRAELEGQWNGQPPPPERFIDLTYYEAALGVRSEIR